MNINRKKVYEREREINVNKQIKKPKKNDLNIYEKSDLFDVVLHQKIGNFNRSFL